MRFGVIYPAYGEQADPSLAAWMAREAERRGAEVFLVWDHFLLPFEGGSARWRPTPSSPTWRGRRRG
jgi:hypothetical protein